MIVNGVEQKENIIIKGAKENNLKNIDVSIPINALTCVTGVSGCGKSSLVYDTIYAESQRDFLESMSGNIYGQKIMNKPQVESFENLRPALNVSQSYYNHNPRSTVGTLSDISHYLRTLYALIINYEFNENYSDSYFSSNNPNSCCNHCKGLGEEYDISIDLLIPDKSKRLKDGAILYYKGNDKSVEYKLLTKVCNYYGIDIQKRFCELNENEIFNLLYRENNIDFDLSFKTPKGRYKRKKISHKGVFIELKEKLNEIDIPSTFINISKYLIKKPCSVCDGTKLIHNVLSKKICNKNIAEVENMQLSNVMVWTNDVQSNYESTNIFSQVKQLLSQIEKRINRLIELKLEYISLSRSIPTLSGGEVQRVRIANQLNCSLKGLIYILDEPCKGLHDRNIHTIINAAKNLVKKGNTVISIEHNKNFISHADKIIELGPEGGPKGGYLINNNASINNYFSNIDFKNENKFKEYIHLENICFRNINKQNVTFPVGAVTCITGVSGSGKSTLISVVSECVKQKKAVFCNSIKGLSNIKNIYVVNQQPIGKTPRSTVASYLEIYDTIRNIFANCEESLKAKLTASDFSMNVEGGRCEHCQGTGLKRIELNYLPDSFVTCPECEGKRFQEKVLSIKYKGMTINDILETPVFELLKIFAENTIINDKLKCLVDIGLGYIKLGQMSMNLSGGEAQRIKLAKALGMKSTGKNLYILDEPTSGLNSKDIEKFCCVINKLQEQNETILIIEHNMEFISKTADYMVDFGVLAGADGGKIVAYGKPKDVYNHPESSWCKTFN